MKKTTRLPRQYVMVQVDDETLALFKRAAKDKAVFLGAGKLGVSTWLRMVGVNAARAHVGYGKKVAGGRR